METASLSNVAPEILLVVFCCLHRLEDVANLASASGVLYNVRNANAHSIYLAVAARSISCMPDAERLLETQEYKDAGASLQTFAEKNRTARSRMRRLVANSRMVLKACDFFEEDIRNYLIEERERLDLGLDSLVLTTSERTRFIHAYYRLWTLAENPSTERPTLMASMGLREILLLNDVGIWAINRLNPERAALLGYIQGDWFSIMMIICYHGSRDCCRAKALHHRMIERNPKLVPYGLLALFDKSQEYMKSVPDIL